MYRIILLENDRNLYFHVFGYAENNCVTKLEHCYSTNLGLDVNMYMTAYEKHICKILYKNYNDSFFSSSVRAKIIGGILNFPSMEVMKLDALILIQKY